MTIHLRADRAVFRFSGLDAHRLLNDVVTGGNSTLVYIVCEDCATEEARVNPAGGRVEKTKFSIGPYGFISLACDTEGNMFGLHSMK